MKKLSTQMLERVLVDALRLFPADANPVVHHLRMLKVDVDIVEVKAALNRLTDQGVLEFRQIWSAPGKAGFAYFVKEAR